MKRQPLNFATVMAALCIFAIFAGASSTVVHAQGGNAQSNSSGQIASPSDIVLPSNSGASSVLESSKVFAEEGQVLPSLPPVTNDLSLQSSSRTEFPKPPESSNTFDRIIDRIEQNAENQPVVEPKLEPKSDLSGDSIREAVKTQYDKEYASDFDDDGWKDVDNSWSQKVNGRLVMDHVMWLDDSEIPGGARDFFEIRQARIGMQGKGYGQVVYKIDFEFEPEASDTDGGIAITRFGTVAMKDMVVGFEDVPLFGRVTFGHQKVNFSMAQMMNRKSLTFLERFPMADPPGFTPGREVGIAALRQSADRNRTLGYGIYLDNISETTMERQDDNQGYLIGSRATLLPYYDEPSDGRYLVHLGMGMIHRNPQGGVVRFRARPSTHEGPFLVDTGAILSNEYRIYGSEFAFQAGAVSFQSEFMYADIDVFGTGQRQLWGCNVEAAWRLTGEHRTYKRSGGFFDELVPYENFWMLPGSRGIGAWEVAAAYSNTDFDDSPVNSEMGITSFALNWYLNTNLRLQMNYIHPVTSGGFIGNTESDALMLRMAAYF